MGYSGFLHRIWNDSRNCSKRLIDFPILIGNDPHIPVDKGRLKNRYQSIEGVCLYIIRWGSAAIEYVNCLRGIESDLVFAIGSADYLEDMLATVLACKEAGCVRGALFGCSIKRSSACRLCVRVRGPYFGSMNPQLVIKKLTAALSSILQPRYVGLCNLP